MAFIILKLLVPNPWGGMFNTCFLRFKYRILASLLLTFVVIEGLLYGTAQHEERKDVNDCHATHGDVSKRPGNIHGVQCTNKYHYNAAATEEEQSHFVVSDKTYVKFCVEVVPNQRGECEERNSHGSEVNTHFTVYRRNSMLHQWNTIEFATLFVCATEEHEETGGRADNHGIDEYGKVLAPSLA